MMKKLMLAAVMAVVAGCGSDGADAFREGIPAGDDVKLKLPSSGQALSAEGTRRDGLVGDASPFYGFTRAVTLMVNGGTAHVLNLVENIVKHRPTTLAQDRAIWGPHTDALSPNTYRFTVVRNAPNDHDYILEAKDKTAADSAYVVILSGKHLKTGEHLGSGNFLIDWDKAAQLPEHGKEVGTGAFSYSRLTATADVVIEAQFDNVKDEDSGQLVDARYKYLAQPGNGGKFDFQMNKDFVTGAAVEAFTVRSRWLQTGSGRSDIQAAGGDLASPVSMSECWGDLFRSSFMNATFLPNGSYGVETDCAFATAEFAQL